VLTRLCLAGFEPSAEFESMTTTLFLCIASLTAHHGIAGVNDDVNAIQLHTDDQLSKVHTKMSRFVHVHFPRPADATSLELLESKSGLSGFIFALNDKPAKPKKDSDSQETKYSASSATTQEGQVLNIFGMSVKDIGKEKGTIFCLGERPTGEELVKAKCNKATSKVLLELPDVFVNASIDEKDDSVDRGAVIGQLANFVKHMPTGHVMLVPSSEVLDAVLPLLSELHRNKVAVGTSSWRGFWGWCQNAARDIGKWR